MTIIGSTMSTQVKPNEGGNMARQRQRHGEGAQK